MSTKDAPLSLTIETIPWQECARLIQNCNARNRPLSEKRIETLIRPMKQDRFLLTHQGVAFDQNGDVIDGQHRLAAAARAKKDLCVVVARYTNATLANEAMAIFDSGRSRSMADGLAIGGIMPKEDAKAMTAVVNVLALVTGGYKLDLQETGEFYKAHRESVRWAIGAIPAKRGGSYIRAAFAIAYEVSPVKVAELAAQINEGTALPNTAASLWNRAVAGGLLTTPGGTSARRDVTYRALRILKAHVVGEAPPSKIYTSDEALQWFLAQRQHVMKPVSEPPASGEKPNGIQGKILAVLPAGGARISDIARKLDKRAQQISKQLSTLVERGLVTKERHGFYVPVQAAA